MLLAENVAVRFRDAQGKTFDGLHIERMEFAPGRLSCVTGPSGSGKSTLLLTLAGLIVPATGSVRWNGDAISTWPEAKRDAWRCRNVGMVFQDFQLIAELSPLANVMLPGSFGGRPNSGALKTRAHALLAELGVPASRRRIEDLSRGEQQRVAIARALLFDPPLLLADEPTASLDRDNAQFVTTLLADAAQKGKMVVAVSHDDLLLREASVVHRLERGMLKAA